MVRVDALDSFSYRCDPGQVPPGKLGFDLETVDGIQLVSPWAKEPRKRAKPKSCISMYIPRFGSLKCWSITWLIRVNDGSETDVH